MPEKADVDYGSMSQNSYCLDTVSHSQGETVEMFQCHSSGGNQNWALTKAHQIKHSEYCLTIEIQKAGESLKLYECNPSDYRQVN